MNAGVVIGIGGVHARAVLGDHGAEIVHIRNLVGLGILLYAGIQMAYLLHRVRDGGAPAEASCRQAAGQDDLHLVIAGYLHHGEHVAVGEIFVVGTGILGDIVRAVVDYDHFGLQVDYVFTEAEQKLVAGLATDSTADDIVVLEELGTRAGPSVGNRVAHQYHTLFSLRRGTQLGVLLGIAPPVGKLVFLRHSAVHTQGGEQHGCHTLQSNHSLHNVFFL